MRGKNQWKNRLELSRLLRREGKPAYEILGGVSSYSLARRSRRSFPAVLREGNFNIKVDPKKPRKVVTVTLKNYIVVIFSRK